ncbi:MAG TPA: hypothetical protein VFX03_06055, partial [Thermomicrobiales bacterium]|nr:hypothetical protein [Thermomicrobiales bacterium]
MDGDRFDHLVRRVSRSRLPRRAALRVGGWGVAGALAGVAWRSGGGRAVVSAAPAAGTPRAAATPFVCPGSSAVEMEIDGAWFCKQTFALCTTSPCERSNDDPAIANCPCVVLDDYAIGYKSCAERAQSGGQLHSNFSTANVNSAFFTMTCPADAPWANCLDMPCTIDPKNPALANCQCQIVDSGPSLTFGGGCDVATCTSAIWSAAPLGLAGLSQLETGMACVDQQVTLPPTCPATGATPEATPT